MTGSEQFYIAPTLRRFAQSRPKLISAFLKAYVEAVRVFKEDREFTLGVLGRAMRSDDRQILEETYGFYRDYFADIPHPTLEGVQLILEELAPKMPKAREARPEDFADPRFVRLSMRSAVSGEPSLKPTAPPRRQSRDNLSMRSGKT